MEKTHPCLWELLKHSKTPETRGKAIPFPQRHGCLSSAPQEPGPEQPDSYISETSDSYMFSCDSLLSTKLTDSQLLNRETLACPSSSVLSLVLVTPLLSNLQIKRTLSCSLGKIHSLKYLMSCLPVQY